MVGYKRVIDECKYTRVENKNVRDLTVYLRQNALYVVLLS